LISAQYHVREKSQCIMQPRPRILRAKAAAMQPSGGGGGGGGGGGMWVASKLCWGIKNFFTSLS
jgi:hypothetical protein